jgi:hypothetical protein
MKSLAEHGIDLRRINGADDRYRATVIARDGGAALANLARWTERLQAEADDAALEAMQTAGQASKEVEALRHAASQAQQLLEAWDARQRVKAQTAPQSGSGAKTPPQRQTSPRPAPQRSVNPQWAELSRLLEEKRTRRTSLLTNLTPAHPWVLDLDLQIEALGAQLSATPQFLGPSVPDPASVPPKNVADEIPAAPENTTAIAVDAGERDRLSQSLEAAKAKLAAAEVKAAQAQERSKLLALGHIKVSQPAHLSAAIGGTPNLGVTVSLALAAVLAGIAMARATAVFAGPGVFTSVAEVGRVLSLPIVAALSTDDGPAVPSSGRVRKMLVRTVVHTSEAIALLLVGLIVCDLATSPLTAQVVWSDPAQAVALAFERFLPF